MKPTNKDAPTCEWATARMPYISPARGGQEPVPVSTKATRGAAVKIAGEWEGHYPSLVGVPGKLIARAGPGWAVKFDGVNGEMFFNTEVGMQQLVLLPVQDPVAVEEVQAQEQQQDQEQQQQQDMPAS